MNIEKVEVIVHEHEKRCFHLDDGTVVNKEVATVGVKMRANGELYGDYVVFNKPTVTVPEVVETANSLMNEILVNLNTGAYH